jgi:ubiquinone/menaquinone biosynthesis C-methylase UbiE
MGDIKVMNKGSNIELRAINAHQMQKYEEYEKGSSENFFKKYSDVLEKMISREDLKVLDIGGASGSFAASLSEYFSDKKCEVFVVDTTPYDAWAEYGNKVNFITASADELSSIFKEN